ncbi:MAG: hypothetical protein ACRBBW_10190 [Cellvibrionaceae bacterium]
MRLFIGLLVLFPLWLCAEEDIRIRAQFVADNNDSQYASQVFEAVVGERVTLAVDVLTSRWFSKAPRFSHLAVRDAINLKAETFATNYSERIGSENYAVQRREYTIFPQRAGQYVIDGVEVIVWVTTGPGKPLEKRTLRSKPLLMMVKALPPVESAESSGDEAAESKRVASLVASDVIIDQRFSSTLDELSVGDLVERRIEIRATGTLGMLIPPLVWPEVSGVKQTSLSSSVDDKTNRGAFEGVRVETRQYTLLDEGGLILPPISMWWWDGDGWQQSQVAQQSISGVKPRVNSSAGASFHWFNLESVDALSVVKLLSALAGLILLSFACWRLMRVIVAGGVEQVREIYHSEFWLRMSLRSRVYFQSPSQIVSAYYRWRNASNQPLKPLPESKQKLWAGWCLMAQQQTRASFSQRRQMWLLITDMNLSAISVDGGSDKSSVSATVSLQPLNPS